TTLVPTSRKVVRRVLHDTSLELSKIRNGDRLVEVFNDVKRYIDPNDTSVPPKEKEEFVRVHYTPFLRLLVKNMGPLWVDLLTPERLELWDSFFLEGAADQAFLVLLDAVDQSGPSVCLDRCVHVLERFIQRGGLADLIWEISKQQLEPNPTPIMHDAILRRICSFPDHLANCLKKQNKHLFYPEKYFPRVAGAIIRVLHMVSDSLREGKNCSISFVSQVLGKACMQGHSVYLCCVLIPHLLTLVESDSIWQRLCWRLLAAVPDRWIEPVVVGILQVARGPSDVSKLFGDLVLKSKQVELLLTQKLIFLQDCSKKLQRILGYLALDSSRRHLIVTVLRQLLFTWSSPSVVRHSTHAHLVHLSRCILICLSLANKEELDGIQDELTDALLTGGHIYLERSLNATRRLGMVVAECLSRYLNMDTDDLSFTFVDDEESLELKSLLSPPCICPKELTDDDDLLPYDLSEDVELKKSRAPAYIRDCMEVLLSDDVERVEVTMMTLAAIVHANVAATKEVSVELAKILLHLSEQSAIEHFAALRHGALVALTVVDPVLVSKYLTGEFYSLNYSLRQRMDILDVLASAAKDLSELVAPAKLISRGPDCVKKVDPSKPEAPVDWRKVVEERIASKTRRFAKGLPAAVPVTAPNSFHAVAGHFFFSLIQNYDRPVVTFNLLGEDRLVLGRLVHTLGIVMHLTLNATVAPQMGKALLEFVWVLRFHLDPYVRQGLLFCVSTVLLSVPWERLMTDMAEEVIETQHWLADVAEKDIDDDCRRIALNGLVLMQKLKSNLEGVNKR
uniref:Telomere length regulation protein TEL2 homolog n=1 Tax=Leptobrachium leishanense TaxID=445787 RepID=A0A8C5R899_9ANUR